MNNAFINWTNSVVTFNVTEGGTQHAVPVNPASGTSPGVQYRPLLKGQRLEVTWTIDGYRRQYVQASQQTAYAFMAVGLPGGWFNLQQ